MRGSIVKKNHKWYIVVDSTDENGKRKRKWISGFNTQKEAEKKLPEILQQLNTNTFVDTNNITLRDYMQLWLEDYAKPNVAPTTYDKYTYAANKVSEILGNMKLQQIKPIHIQQLVNKLNNSDVTPSTVLSYYRVLNTAINQAVKWQFIQYNPCVAVTPPRNTKNKMMILDQDEIQILLDKSKDHVLYPVIVLALLCGLRRGEILGLKWENIDFFSGVIHLENNLVMANNESILKETKTSTGRRAVDISSNVVEVLKKVKKQKMSYKLLYGSSYHDSNFVCTWEDGRPFRPDYIPKAFAKILVSANLPKIRFHDLRHTHASILLKSGIHPKVVQERLGHSSISITLDTYSHLVPSLQKSAAEKMATMFSI